MNKTIKFAILGMILLGLTFATIVSCLISIPIDTTASDEFSVNISNDTNSMMIAVGLEYDEEKNTYTILSSVHKPPLFYILNFIPANKSVDIRYDMSTTNSTIFFLGTNMNKEKYIATSKENSREITFDETSKTNELENVIGTSWNAILFHLFLAIFFYTTMKILLKYFIKSEFGMKATKIALITLMILNLIYGSGYLLVTLIIKFCF